MRVGKLMSSIPKTYYKYKKHYKKIREEVLPDVSQKAAQVEKFTKWVPGSTAEMLHKGAKWVRETADKYKLAPGTVVIPDKYK